MMKKGGVHAIYLLVAFTTASFRESDAASVIVVLSPTIFSVVRFCLNENG